LTWAGTGQQITVQGHTIKNPMTYWSDDTSSDEASCINRSLIVGDPNDEDISPLPYWPRYSVLTPAQKGKYLSWMSSGRNDTLDEIGYAFIFFYGLERRIIIDKKDIENILEETRRLLSRYPTSNSFNSYLNNFIAFNVASKIQEMDDSKIQKFFPALDELDITSTMTVLAWYTANAKKIPWELAYSIARIQKTVKSNIPKKYPDTFKQLFEKKFFIYFPEGLSPVPATYQYTLDYRHASPSLNRYSRFSDGSKLIKPVVLNIPDISIEPFKSVLSFWTESIDEFKPASNRLNNTNGKITREVYSVLPDALKDRIKHPDLESWQRLVSSKVPIKDTIIIHISELAALLGMGQRQNLTALQSSIITSTAHDVGFVLVPDHTISGSPYKWNDSIAIIPTSDKTIQISENFQRIALIFEMAYAVAASDERVSEDEENFLKKFISGRSSLNSFEIECLKALQKVLEIEPPALSKIGKRLSKRLDQDQKAKIANFLIDIVLLDGKFTKDEQKSLKSVFKALEIDPLISDELFKKALVGYATEEPTTVVKAKKSRKGEAIPRPVAPPAFKIDEEKLRRRIIETQEVHEILGTVFEQEHDEETRIERESAAKVPETVCENVVLANNLNLPFPTDSLVSLNVKYLTILNDLMMSKEMSKDNFTILVRKHNLMPQAVFDDINTWADDVFEDYLLEDHEDRIIINFRK
jgi:uncharacterized tellurite resistance protein B-like protein